MRTDIGRSALVDMAKGIGITLVVYGHCLRGLISAGFVPQDSPLIISDYIVYTFHMPLFFIASGLFFEKSLHKSHSFFFKNSLKNILYPYFFWSILCGSIQIILSGSSATNNEMSISRLFEILWNPISPFWFLYALFFCYAISWACKTTSIILRIFVGFSIFIISFYNLEYVINDIFYGFTYFSIGIFVKRQNLINFIPSSYKAALGIVAVFFITALVFYYLGVPERMPFIATIMGVIATATICRLMEYNISGRAMVNLLSLLGQYSLSIYVMHIIVIAAIRTILIRIFMVDNITAVIILATSCGIFFPVLVQKLLLKLKINNLLGLPFSAGRVNSTPA